MNDEAGARNLVLEVQRNGRAASVSVRGELDVSTAPELADRCRLLHAEGTLDVELDLEETSFLDSSGLRALIGARHVFGDAGGNLRLTHPSEPVMRLLSITGLTGYFSIEDGRST